MIADIFVQIPAYRDSQLSSTVLNLLRNRSNQFTMRICVLWQHGPDEKLSELIHKHPDIEVIKISHEKSKGSNWARFTLQKYWRGERYTLLLDSHHRFVKNWDKILVDMYQSLKRDGIPKPIITSYLPPYVPEEETKERLIAPCKIYPLTEERIEGLLYRLTSLPIPGWRKLQKPIAAEFLCLHLLFTEGIFNEEVVFDPTLYYSGDEILTTIRAYSHGYDLFHPHQLIGWHLYARETRQLHWADDPTWRQRDHHSLKAIRSLFNGTYQGNYPLGVKRSVKTYERLIGIPLISKS